LDLKAIMIISWNGGSLSMLRKSMTQWMTDGTYGLDWVTGCPWTLASISLVLIRVRPYSGFKLGTL
jgi:hypothetical protein